MNFKDKRLLLLNALLFVSCSDCKKLAPLYKENECSLIIHKKSGDIYSFYRGINPYTGKECDCTDGYRDYMQYQNYMEVGDTLIKKKGDMFLSLHKKDTIMVFNWYCEARKYK